MSREPDDTGTLYTPPGPLALHHRAILWGIFVAALLLRLAYLRQLRESPLWEDLPVDLGYYRDWGLRIARGEWVGEEVFEQSPFYAYFLGLIFKIFGPGLLAPRLVQAVVGSATCVMVYRIGRQMFTPAAGLAAALLGAVYGPFLFYDGMLMKEVFAVFFLTAAVMQLLDADGSQRGLLATSGLCLGLAALVRDNMILLAPVIAVWLVADPWLRGRMAGGRLKEGLGRAAAFAVGVSLVVLPVTARNYHVSGDLVLLTAGGGEVFYIGNNPQADGRYAPPPFVRAASVVEHEDFRREAARRLGRELSRKEASDYWRDQGLAWIRRNPGDWLRLTLRKLQIFWNRYELPDNHSYDHHRRLLPILQLPLVTFGWLVPLAAAGALLALFRWRETLLVLLLTAAYAGSVALFFNFGRFRMPIIPLLLVLAGHGIAGLAAAIRKRRLYRAAAAVVAALAALAICVQQLEDDALHDGQSHGRMAELLRRADRLEEAQTEVESALGILEGVFTRMGGQLGPGGHGVPAPGRPGRPDLGEGFYAVLGEAYQTRSSILKQKGQLAEAEVWARHAASVQGDPDATPEALTRAGQRAMEGRDFDKAAAAFRRALAAIPAEGAGADPRGRVRISLHLAEALHRSGKPREALEVVEKALDGAPDLPPLDRADAHFGEALIYRELDEPELMRFNMRECLRLNPSHPRADWMRRILDEGVP